MDVTISEIFKCILSLIDWIIEKMSPSYKLNADDRKIHTELQEQIIHCCDEILKTPPQFLIEIAEKELDKLQKIKISTNSHIISENIVNLLNKIIHETANLISFETIICNNINHSIEEKEAVSKRLKSLATISKLRKEMEIAFRIATIKKGLIIWKK